MAEPTPETSEEDVITTRETGTSETEPSDTEVAKAETSNPEPCDAEPRKAKQKTAQGRCCRLRPCGRRCRRHSNFSSFATYFPRVLRQVHSGLSLSRESVHVLDSFVKDMFERIAEEAGGLAHRNKRCTIKTEDIQTAVRLLLPGELGKYAMAEASKSLARYRTSR